MPASSTRPDTGHSEADCLRIVKNLKLYGHWRTILQEENRKGGGALVIEDEGFRIVLDYDFHNVKVRYTVQSSPILTKYGGR